MSDDPTGPLAQFRGPPVDPRFRKRWAEARRAEGRRRLHILLGAAGALAVVAACVGLLFSPLFRVRNVVIMGNTHTPRAEVLDAAGLGDAGKDVLMVDGPPPGAERAVDALPWVAQTTFERRWPWTLVIRVKERSPVAAVMAGTAQAEDIVDESGRVLAVDPAAAGLPVISGVQPAPPGSDISPGPGLDRPEMHELLAAAHAAPQALVKRGLRLAYSSADGLTGYVGSDKTVVLLGDGSELATKLTVLEELVGHVNLAGYSQADLTVPERPALTPLPSGPPGTA